MYLRRGRSSVSCLSEWVTTCQYHIHIATMNIFHSSNMLIYWKSSSLMRNWKRQKESPVTQHKVLKDAPFLSSFFVFQKTFIFFYFLFKTLLKKLGNHLTAFFYSLNQIILSCVILQLFLFFYLFLLLKLNELLLFILPWQIKKNRKNKY